MSRSNSQTPIEEKLLGHNDLFALRFAEGLVFFEVDGYEEVQYKPYTGIGKVSAEGSTGWTVLKHNNDEILNVPENEQKVLHVAIGQNSSVVRRYTNYPEAQNRLRKMPNLNSPSPSRGDDFGYVDGDSSPYSNPTDAEELFIPPGQSLDFNFYNPDDREREVSLSIKGRVYDVNVLDPHMEQNKSAVRRVVKPGSAPPIANVGSPDNQANFKHQNEWGVSPVSLGKVRMSLK